ncbi:MAG: adenylate/guanylate cyclase domain-containing protein [Marinobacterium sp.]|nr:adenylate/guanylate cyclase domain-containing protein [Marinobacterium sp.]
MMQRLVRMLCGLLITAFALLMVWMNEQPELSQRLELDLYDLRLKRTLPNELDPRVVIIDIDEKSLAIEGQWPWRRDRLARLVEQLVDHYGVALVGFDMTFPEADERLSRQQLVNSVQAQGQAVNAEQLDSLISTIDPDRRFAQTIASRPVVLGYVFDRTQGTVGTLPVEAARVSEFNGMLPVPSASGYIGNLALLQQATPWAGFFDNPSVDADGTYRRVPLLQRYQGGYYPSLALAVFMALMGEERVTAVQEAGADSRRQALTAVDVAGIQIPVDAGGNVLVPYRGPMGSFPYVSASDVMAGTAAMETLEGAIVLVGTSAAGLLDLRVTPLQNRYAGVEVHANIVSGLLDERFYYQPDYVRGIELMQLLLTGLVLSLLMPWLSASRGTLLALTWGGFLIGSNLYAWQQWHWVLPLGMALQLLIVLYLFGQFTGYFFETRNRRRLASQFGQYIPQEIVDELNSGGKKVDLKGESREMTVFFSDVRGFTGLSEQLDPQQLTRLMNMYLTHMTEIIYRHRGTVDKYIGDAVMAFWGAPLEDQSHALRALDAALEMDRVMPRINEELAAEGLPPIAIGMGINTGVMNIGNMGSSYRMAYTVMGDAVNLGSRLEGLTKFYGVPLIVSDETARHVECYRFMMLDRVQVKGRAEPVTLYQPLGRADEIDRRTLALAERFNGAMGAFQRQDWADLKQRLDSLTRDDFNPQLIKLYQERLAVYRENPPPVEWDGVFTHTSK